MAAWVSVRNRRPDTPWSNSCCFSVRSNRSSYSCEWSHAEDKKNNSDQDLVKTNFVVNANLICMQLTYCATRQILHLFCPILSPRCLSRQLHPWLPLWPKKFVLRQPFRNLARQARLDQLVWIPIGDWIVGNEKQRKENFSFIIPVHVDDILRSTSLPKPKFCRFRFVIVMIYDRRP